MSAVGMRPSCESRPMRQAGNTLALATGGKASCIGM
jgi:hypothetical protein